MSWGVPTVFGNLRQVLMHRPGDEIDLVTASTFEDLHFARQVEKGLFINQYNQMVSLFEAHDVEILFLKDVLKDDQDSLGFMKYRPNMMYTRDLATVFGNGAVIMGPHLKSRQGDQRILTRVLKRLDVPILGTIQPPGYLEGGGVTMIGDDTVVASLCDRANEHGVKQLRDMVFESSLSSIKYFLEVPLPSGYIHIDGVFLVLDQDLCFIYEDAFKLYPCRLYERGDPEPSHFMFSEILDRYGFQTIALERDEMLKGHLNMVVTQRSKNIIGSQSAQRLVQELKKLGRKVSTYPTTELSIGNGGAHCSTCPLWVS